MAPSPSKTPTLSTPGSNPGMGLGRADSASSMQSDRPPRPQPMKPPTAEAAQRLRERQAELMDEKCRFLVLILIALGREASWSMGVQQASLGAAAPSLAVAEHPPWTELLPYTFQASLQLLASLNMLRSQLEEAQTIFQGVRRLFVSQSDRVVFREMQDVWGRLDEAGLMPLLQALVARVDGVDARVAAVSSPAATGSAVTGPTSAEPSERTLASHVAASADAMLLENTTPESRREFIRLADGVMDGLATLSSHREGRHGAPISPVSPMSSLASPTSHQFTGRDHVHGHGHDHGDGEDDKAGHTGRRLSRHRRQGQPAFNVHPVDGEGRAIHLVRRIKHFVLFVAGIYAMLTIVFYLVGCPYRPGAEAIPATPGKLPAMPVDTHATARAQAQAQAHAHTHGDRKWTSLREAALCPITTVQHDPLLLIVGHRAAHVRAAAVAALPPTVVASWQAYVAPPLQTTTAALQTAWQTALDPVWRTDALDRVLTAVPAAWQHAGQTAETFVVAPVFTTGSYVRFLIGRNVTPRERAAWQQWQTRLAQTLSSRVHAWRRQWAPPPYNHASGTPS
ncbi:hypothetical protein CAUPRSCDRAFT_12068 [Caulochytrium protostelioides]|uniref:Uncharacterized protein n=1 Tax=Caulochytrium protostelioides TaxID=1555241 RepID=A0A4P9WSN6_9FUNG|nr:hypothetical protein CAUPRSCDRAFT_12068 [Caulochytrium protostelioides]